MATDSQEMLGEGKGRGFLELVLVRSLGREGGDIFFVSTFRGGPHENTSTSRAADLGEAAGLELLDALGQRKSAQVHLLLKA